MRKEWRRAKRNKKGNSDKTIKIIGEYEKKD